MREIRCVATVLRSSYVPLKSSRIATADKHIATVSRNEEVCIWNVVRAMRSLCSGPAVQEPICAISARKVDRRTKLRE